MSKTKIRGHGEGTLRKRKDGRWEGRLITGYDEKGKPKFRYFYGKRQKDVIAKMDTIKAELNFGTYIEPHKVTFGEWLDLWLDTYKKDNIRPSTYTNYEGQIRLHLRPHLGNILLKDLQTNQIQQLFNWMFREGKSKKGEPPAGMSRKTIELTRIIASAALDKAVEDDLILKNPCKGTTLPQEEPQEVEPFTREEALRILETVKDDRLYAIYFLMFGAGLRRGEALGLKWRDINFKESKMHIKRSLREQKDDETGKYLLKFSPPKSKKSRRTIPLTPELVAVLKAHKAKQAEEKLFFGEEYHNEDLVFCKENGERIWPRCFHRHYTDSLKATGVSHKKPHTMRHTFCTLLIEEGEDLRIVQELAGHASLAITAGIYVHVLERTKKKAVTKLSSILTPESARQEI